MVSGKSEVLSTIASRVNENVQKSYHYMDSK